MAGQLKSLRRNGLGQDLAVGTWRETGVRTTEEVIGAADAVIAAMTRLGYGTADLLGMRLALEEALLNALEHGRRGQASKAVLLSYQVKTDGVVAEVRDHGSGFDPNRYADPADNGPLERGQACGLRIMRRHTNWVRFNRRGNCVTLCKYRYS
jgi:serine/threonine-protein kinase RsbW